MSVITVASYRRESLTSRIHILNLVLSKPVVGVLLLVVFILVGIELVFANYLATQGVKLATLNEEIKTIQNENDRLKVEIAKATSLANIEARAKELGLKKSTRYLYISQSFSLASK